MRDDDPRLELPDRDGELRPRLGSILDSTIGESEVLPHGDAHHLRGFRGFLCSQLRSSAAGHLSSRQIDDPCRPAEHLGANERAATNELDIVGVGGDGEDVNLFHAENLLVPQGIYRVELRGSLCREHSEYYSDAHRDHHGDYREPDRDTGVDVHRQRSESSKGQPDENPEDTTEAGERGGLDQELKQYLPP